MKEENKSIASAAEKSRFRFNRKLTTVLICLLISIIFWLLIALSRDYPARVSFPIVYTNLPGSKIIVNDLPDTLALQIKAKGFRILTFQFSSKRKPIQIDVASRLMSGRALEGEVLVLPTRAFAADFSRQFGPDISITGYQPDSIVFYFNDMVRTRLPVNLNLNISFEKQYDFAGDIRIVPDSVDVSGPPLVLKRIKKIETEPVRLSGVRTNILTDVKLKPVNLLTYSEEKVSLNIQVEKFTEGIINARIQAINVPAGYSLKTFPDRAGVRYLVALSQYKDVEEHMFEVSVDAGTIAESNPAKLPVSVVRYPEFVRSVKLEPEKVDYILRRK